MSALGKAEISAIRRCDGMGEAAEDGDYVLMSVEHDRERIRLFSVSIGAAALLVDELRSCLSAAGHLREGLVYSDASMQLDRILEPERTFRKRILGGTT